MIPQEMGLRCKTQICPAWHSWHWRHVPVHGLCSLLNKAWVDFKGSSWQNTVRRMSKGWVWNGQTFDRWETSVDVTWGTAVIVVSLAFQGMWVNLCSHNFFLSGRMVDWRNMKIWYSIAHQVMRNHLVWKAVCI